jgi:hypothetical protein
MSNAADKTVVPALPVRIAGKSFKAPIAALLPVASAKRQAASTFGPIEPAGKLKPRIAWGLAIQPNSRALSLRPTNVSRSRLRLRRLPAYSNL